MFQTDPGWSQWDDWNKAWYILCDSSHIEISPLDHPDRAILHYEGNTTFDIVGLTAYVHKYTQYRSINRICVPQNHFYWASETGTHECTTYSDQLTVYNSLTLYIDYFFRELSWGWYFFNGAVFTPSIRFINITAKGLTRHYPQEATLILYWNWYSYRCSISFNNMTESYSCNAAELNLTTTTCPEYAFAVGLNMHDEVLPNIFSISITDEDGATQIMNETIYTNQSSIVVDFTTVWSQTDLDVYTHDLDSTCFLDTGSSVFLLSPSTWFCI